MVAEVTYRGAGGRMADEIGKPSDSNREVVQATNDVVGVWGGHLEYR